MHLALLRKSPPNLIPFPGLVFNLIYYIGSFLHIVGLAKWYTERAENESPDFWQSVSKKRREIQTVGCQKKSTSYNFFTQVLSLVLLNKPSIFLFMISSVVVSHTTAFFSFPEKKKDENKGEWEKNGFFLNLKLCTQQLYIERLKWTQWYVIDNFIGHMSALVMAEDGKFLFWSSDSKIID